MEPFPPAIRQREVGVASLASGCVLLAVLSLLLPVTVSYDPLAWLVWGREVAGLRLDTTVGPVWKPLPVLLDAVFSLFGDLAPPAWLVVARGGGLLALALAYRLAASVGGALAGVLAATVLVTSSGYALLVLPGMSEPLLAALVLVAVDQHRRERRGAALVALVAAALLRPEVWPFLGLYGLLLWIREPQRRRALLGAAVAVVVPWFGGELWGSGSVLRSVQRASQPSQGGPLLTAHPALNLLETALHAPVAAAWVGVVASLGFAVARSRRVGRPIPWPMPATAADRLDGSSRFTTFLTLSAVGWLGTVVVMTEARVSAGDERYLLVAVAVLAVVAGIGWARLLTASWQLLRARPRLTRAAGAGVLLVLAQAVADSWPVVASRAAVTVETLRTEYAKDESPAALAAVVDQVGGRDALLRCGTLAVGPYEFPLAAWVLDVPMSALSLQPHSPGVILRVGHRPSNLPIPPPAFRQVPLSGTAARQWQVYTTCELPHDQVVGPSADSSPW